MQAAPNRHYHSTAGSQPPGCPHIPDTGTVPVPKRFTGNFTRSHARHCPTIHPAPTPPKNNKKTANKPVKIIVLTLTDVQHLPVAGTAIERRNAANLFETVPQPTPLEPPVWRLREPRIYTHCDYALRDSLPQLVRRCRRPIHLEQPRTVVRVHDEVKPIELETPGLVVPQVGPCRLEGPLDLAPAHFSG